MVKYLNETHQSTRRLEKRSVDAVVHLVVESASVAQVVACAVATPQWRRDGAAVDAFPAFQIT